MGIFVSVIITINSYNYKGNPGSENTDDEIPYQNQGILKHK